MVVREEKAVGTTHFFSIVESFPSWVLIRLCVIDLQCSKQGIFEPNVETNNVVYDRIVLVCLQWRRDCQVGRSVSVENIHEFRLLHRRNHNTATLGIGGKILPRDDSSRARLPIGFLM